jgi:hypothetical protein
VRPPIGFFREVGQVCHRLGEVLRMIPYFDVIPCEVWPEWRRRCQ